MMKRITGAAKAVAEQAGIINPSVPDAQTALEARRAEMTADRAAVERAEAELDRGLDLGQAPKELQACEAALAAARTQAERSARALASAERRYKSATETEQDKSRAEHVIARDAALDADALDAVAIEELIAKVAEHVRAYDLRRDVYAEAARQGVAARTAFSVTGLDLVKAALRRSGIERGVRIFDGLPEGAVQVAERARGAILATVG